jgi:hypothetical protein
MDIDSKSDNDVPVDYLNCVRIITDEKNWDPLTRVTPTKLRWKLQVRKMARCNGNRYV